MKIKVKKHLRKGRIVRSHSRKGKKVRSFILKGQEMLRLDGENMSVAKAKKKYPHLTKEDLQYFVDNYKIGGKPNSSKKRSK